LYTYSITPILRCASLIRILLPFFFPRHTQNLPLPTSNGGPYTGDLTYYEPGLGACGITSASSDSICAVSHLVFDAAQKGSNPNSNPLCGLKLRLRRDGKSVDVTVVDRCVGCKATDIDTTTSVFSQLAGIVQGRVPVDWAWLETAPVSVP
jgi:expansin (peptidoglycan-binding protein)